MSSTYMTVVTDAGTQKMLEAVNEGKKVNIVEFAVGDGGGRFYTPSTDMTELKREVWRGAVNACYVSEESENVLVTQSIMPADSGGFTIREMGLFDDEGILIAICNTPDIQKAKVADGAVSELDLFMEIVLVNTESVKLITDPSVIVATKKDINNMYLKIMGEFEKVTDEIKRNMLNMAMIVATIKGIDFIDLNNMVIETFEDSKKITMIKGVFDSINKRVYA